MPDAIASPCTGVCVVDRTSGLCRGCCRTLDEIAGWSAASDEGRREVLARLAERRARDADLPCASAGE